MRKIELITMLVIAAWATNGYADEVRISTYYPSPYGSYKNLDTTEDTHLATTQGNVGIGTAAPTDKLNVQGGNIGLQGGNIQMDNAASIGVGSNQARTIYDGTAGNAFAALEVGGQERMRLVNGGAVGIGVNAPARFLDVKGSVAAGQHTAGFRDNNDYGVAIGGTQNGGTYGSIQAFQAGAGGVNVNLGIQPLGGSLGVGTYNPNAKLDVAGDVKIGSIAGGGACNAGRAGVVRFLGGHLEYCEGGTGVWIQTGTYN